MKIGDVIAVIVPATVVAMGSEKVGDTERTVLSAAPQGHLSNQFTVYEDETVLFTGAKLVTLTEDKVVPAPTPTSTPTSTPTP